MVQICCVDCMSELSVCLNGLREAVKNMSLLEQELGISRVQIEKGTTIIYLVE
jgi:hypothetical protein